MSARFPCPGSGAGPRPKDPTNNEVKEKSHKSRIPRTVGAWDSSEHRPECWPLATTNEEGGFEHWGDHPNRPMLLLSGMHAGTGLLQEQGWAVQVDTLVLSLSPAEIESLWSPKQAAMSHSRTTFPFSLQCHRPQQAMF